jgi:hypothetical protein
MSVLRGSKQEGDVNKQFFGFLDEVTLKVSVVMIGTFGVLETLNVYRLCNVYFRSRYLSQEET